MHNYDWLLGKVRVVNEHVYKEYNFDDMVIRINGY